MILAMYCIDKDCGGMGVGITLSLAIENIFMSEYYLLTCVMISYMIVKCTSLLTVRASSVMASVKFLMRFASSRAQHTVYIWPETCGLLATHICGLVLHFCVKFV